MSHCAPEAVCISQKILAEIIRMLLHACKEPGDRLHERIVVHDRIPFVTLQPCLLVAVMLRKYQGIGISFLYRLAESLPEVVVKIL